MSCCTPAAPCALTPPLALNPLRRVPRLPPRAQLVELGILADVDALRASKKAGKKAVAPKAPKAAPPAPSRSSGRLATAPRVNYRAEKVVLGSDDEGASDDEGESDDDDASGDESDDESDEGECVARAAASAHATRRAAC
jgi:hypothetical protein